MMRQMKVDKLGIDLLDARSGRHPEGPRRQAVPADPDRAVRGDGDRPRAGRDAGSAPALARPDAHDARVAAGAARAHRHPRHQGLDLLRQADRAPQRRHAGDRRAPVRRHRARPAHASADLTSPTRSCSRRRSPTRKPSRKRRRSSAASSKNSSRATSKSRARREHWWRRRSAPRSASLAVRVFTRS